MGSAVKAGLDDFVWVLGWLNALLAVYHMIRWVLADSEREEERRFRLAAICLLVAMFVLHPDRGDLDDALDAHSATP